MDIGIKLKKVITKLNFKQFQYLSIVKTKKTNHWSNNNTTITLAFS